MQLIVFITFLVLLVYKVRFSIFDSIISFCQKLHWSCMNELPQNSNFLPELQALVCGENFQQMNSAHLYVSSGLIHLFVVSGAHLLVLEKILRFIFSFFKEFFSPTTESFLVFTFLLFYAGICELNPPVTRALLLFCLTDTIFFGKIFWPRSNKIFLAGLVCLFLHPQWITSLSLQLSWLIALAGLLATDCFKITHRLASQTFHFLMIYPTLLLFQNPSFFSIFLNLIFSWFLELILFPLALLVTGLPFLTPLFDFLMQLLKTILQNAELNLLPSTLTDKYEVLQFNWGLILTTHVALHFFNLFKKRNSHEVFR